MATYVWRVTRDQEWQFRLHMQALQLANDEKDMEAREETLELIRSMPGFPIEMNPEDTCVISTIPSPIISDGGRAH